MAPDPADFEAPPPSEQSRRHRMGRGVEGGRAGSLIGPVDPVPPTRFRAVAETSHGAGRGAQLTRFRAVAEASGGAGGPRGVVPPQSDR